MRHLFATVAISLVACVGLIGCVEDDGTTSGPEPVSHTVIIEGEGGSAAFEVTVTDELGSRTSEEVMAYIANIKIERTDKDMTVTNLDDKDIVGVVPPATPTVQRLAEDGFFEVEVNPRGRLADFDWRWQFDDIGHAQGACPGM